MTCNVPVAGRVLLGMYIVDTCGLTRVVYEMYLSRRERSERDDVWSLPIMSVTQRHYIRLDYIIHLTCSSSVNSGHLRK